MKELINFIKYGFEKEDLFPFFCPKCKQKTLVLDEDKWFSVDNYEHMKIEDEYDPLIDSSINYSAVYNCKTRNCNTSVFSSGIGFYDPIFRFDDDGYQSIYGYDIKYRPSSFNPHLSFFEPPINTPTIVKMLINTSFSIALMSPSSALNLIRTCIEKLLNELEIQKERNLNLRIHSLKKIKPELSEYIDHLTALRCLGNSGSHDFYTITYDDLQDAYEIFEVLLSKLYPNPTNSTLHQRIKKIIKNKGPLTRPERRNLS